jgi:hypothetical protein
MLNHPKVVVDYQKAVVDHQKAVVDRSRAAVKHDIKGKQDIPDLLRESS